MENKTVDICVVTYNRLAYLELCIWSILASTKINYRLFVISDNSTDGTNEWLLKMKDLGKIDEVIINETNLGSAESFNKVIRATDSNVFVMACDDIWFHRDWDVVSLDVFKKYRDCGIVTFFNIPQLKSYNQNTRVSENLHKIQVTGLGASIMTRELFNASKGFQMPAGIKMGYFAGPFCQRASKTRLVRKRQYITVPEYAFQMDRNNPADGHLPPPKTSQEYLYRNYNIRRGEEKNKFRKSRRK